jgi:hypothetical protein
MINTTSSEMAVERVNHRRDRHEAPSAPKCALRASQGIFQRIMVQLVQPEDVFGQLSEKSAESGLCHNPVVAALSQIGISAQHGNWFHQGGSPHR